MPKFGKYRVIGELGSGGMAEVYLAVIEGPAGSGFRKLQVIKSLKKNLAEDGEFVAMFLDEARLAARVNHPNVVQTNEIGQDGDQHYIAMEYLDGQPLNRILTRARKGGTPVPTGIYLSILAEVLAGLHHAHELEDFDGTPLHVVHRDATPHNIFVTYEGQVKLVDFGIAKAARRQVETRTGVVKGKTSYMAPEQVTGLNVDRRVDVFAVGVMAYEAATGQRMWAGVEDITIMHRLIAGDIPSSPMDIRPDVPVELDQICRKALSADPDKRYATALEFQQALESYLAQAKLRARHDEIKVLVRSLFEDKRKEVNSMIERQLSTLTAGAMDIDVDLAKLGSASLSNPGSFSGTMKSNVVSAPVEEPTRTYHTAFFRTAKGKGLIVGGALAVAVVIAFAGLRAGSSSSKAAVAPLTEATPSPPPPPPATAEKTHIVIRATPADARISIDDGPPLANPFSMTAPSDGTTHKIRVQAPNYREEVREVTYRADILIDLALEPAVAAAPVGRGGPRASGRPGSAGGRPPIASTPPPPPPPPPVASAPLQHDGPALAPARKKNLDPNNPYGTGGP